MGSDEHPLLTKRMGGALTVLVGATGIGLTLMSFNLRFIGMSLSLIGTAGAVSIYRTELQQLRLCLIGNGHAKPLYAEIWIILVATVIAVIVPAYVWYNQTRPVPPIIGAIRHLAPDSQTRMKSALELSSPDEHYTFQINTVPSCDECEQFADELRKFFNSIPGWTAGGGPLIFPSPHPTHGMWLISSTNKKKSKPVNMVGKAFSDAGLPLTAETEEFPDTLPFVVLIGRQ